MPPPLVTALCGSAQVAPMFDAPAGMKGYVGEEDGFDPLGLSDIFDMASRARVACM